MLFLDKETNVFLISQKKMKEIKVKILFKNWVKLKESHLENNLKQWTNYAKVFERWEKEKKRSIYTISKIMYTKDDAKSTIQNI